MKKVREQATKSSIATIVSGAFIAIVLLFLTNALVSFAKLNNFQSILADINTQLLPESTKASQIYNQLNEIAYLLERLTVASSNAERRITLNELRGKEIELGTLISELSTVTPHLKTQIETARREVIDLNKIIIQRLNTQQLVNDRLETIYHLNQRVLALGGNTQSDRANGLLIKQLALEITHAISNASYSLSLQRLQPVRQISKQTQLTLTASKLAAENSAGQNATILLQIISELDLILHDVDGLFNLKIKQLQTNGRVRGRGNFLRHLLLDISHLAESNAYRVNERILKESQQSTKSIADQIRWTVIASVLVIVFLFAIIYLIRKRIVERLVRLNKKVRARIHTNEVKIDIKGNDEIADLARSFIYFSEKVEKQKSQLQQLSLTDGLTKLANRRALDERLKHDLHTAQRSHWPISVLMLDIDYFKPYNDNYGHVSGDECLQKVSQCLKDLKQRDSDFIARYGGEEFVMLLPATDKTGALKVAKRITEAIHALKIPHTQSEVSAYVTVSIGVNTYIDATKESVDSILQKADKALYYAKENGRNRYVHADELIAQ